MLGMSERWRMEWSGVSKRARIGGAIVEVETNSGPKWCFFGTNIGLLLLHDFFLTPFSSLRNRR